VVTLTVHCGRNNMFYKYRAYLSGDPFPVAAVHVAGIRTMVAIPMLKENAAVGALAIYRKQVRPFTDKQIEYRALKDLGFSHVSARPKAYNQNADAMEAFKKTFPPAWRKSGRSLRPAHR
jgi:Winged helix-turn helix